MDIANLADKIFIVIPVYNESDTLVQLVKEIIALGYKNIVIVDDASHKSVTEIFQSVGQKPVILTHRENCGKGGALNTGIKYAYNNMAEYIACLDGDGQHEARDIWQLLIPLISDGYDISLGSRFLNSDILSNDIPILRYYILQCANIFTWLMTGLWINDSQNGMKAFTRSVAKEIDLFFTRFESCIEIIDLIRKHNFNYTEIPITVNYTEYSLTKGQKDRDGFWIVYSMVTAKFANSSRLRKLKMRADEVSESALREFSEQR